MNTAMWQKARVLPCKGETALRCDGVIHGCELWVRPVADDAYYYDTNTGDGTLKEFVELLPEFCEHPPMYRYEEWKAQCRAQKQTADAPRARPQ